MTITAYPLQWPPGWPRTDATRREGGRFKVTLAGAMATLRDELRLLGAKNEIVSSNVSLGDQNPKDVGIAVYFDFDGQPACIPCDRWNRVEANVQAIAKTIEAMRGIERWGAKHMLKAAFRGFAALSGPSTGRTFREVLGLGADATKATAEAAYRRLRSQHHPDKGGGAIEFHELQLAWEQAQAVLR